MNTWSEIAANNILPLSQSNILREALNEWYYTGEVIDLETASESCQLCNYPNIRYKFEIINELNQNHLYVGSECIKKFGILAIDENGEVLDIEESIRLVNKDRRSIEKKAKDKRIINNILILSEYSTIINFETFIKYYSENGAFTPNQLSLLIWQLEENNVDFKIKDYKIKIRRNREKEQLLKMPDWKIGKIWQCMTATQKDFYIDNK